MAPNQDTGQVLIIGAGAAGLLTAQILKKEGIECIVFEQDATPHSRVRDWNYGIYWAQSSLSECLPQELVDQLEAAQVDSHKPSETDVLPAYNGKTGEKIVDIPAPYCYRLNRRRFLKLIATGIDIRWGKRLQAVDSDGTDVTVKFEDGTQETGQLLIGAEGAHSHVREYLVGKDNAALSPSPVVSSIAVPRLPADVALAVRKLHPRYCTVFHPDGYFMWVGIHDETGQPGDWQFLTILSWIANEPTGLSGNAILDDLKERASGFAEPFRSVFQTLPPGEKVWHTRLSFWETQPWDNHNGTITLAGDAAHSMTFHRGQGLNNAILDAASLGHEIAKLSERTASSIRHALAAYETEVWKRGRDAVISSNLNSLSIHSWEQLKSSPLFKMGLKRLDT